MACELVTKTQVVNFDVKARSSTWRQRSRFQLLPSDPEALSGELGFRVCVYWDLFQTNNSKPCSSLSLRFFCTWHAQSISFSVGKPPHFQKSNYTVTHQPSHTSRGSPLHHARGVRAPSHIIVFNEPASPASDNILPLVARSFVQLAPGISGGLDYGLIIWAGSWLKHMGCGCLEYSAPCALYTAGGQRDACSCFTQRGWRGEGERENEAQPCSIWSVECWMLLRTASQSSYMVHSHLWGKAERGGQGFSALALISGVWSRGHFIILNLEVSSSPL